MNKEIDKPQPPSVLRQALDFSNKRGILWQSPFDNKPAFPLAAVSPQLRDNISSYALIEELTTRRNTTDSQRKRAILNRVINGINERQQLIASRLNPTAQPNSHRTTSTNVVSTFTLPSLQHFSIQLLFESQQYVDAYLLAKKVYFGPNIASPALQLDFARFAEQCALELEKLTVMTMTSGATPDALSKFDNSARMFIEAEHMRRALGDADKQTITVRGLNLKLRPLSNSISSRKLYEELARCYINLSVVLERKDKRDESLAILRRALSILEREVHPEQDAELVAICLHNIGTLTDVHKNRKPEALWYLQRAIEMRRRLYAHFNGSRERLADSLEAYGQIVLRMGDRELGIAVLREAADEYVGLFTRRRGNTRVVAVLNSIALALERSGDVRAGIELKRFALNLLRELFPTRHHELVASLCDSLGVSLEETGQTDEGVRLKREALAIREAIFAGMDHPDLAASYNNFASTLEGIGSTEKALELRRKACGMYERIYVAPNGPQKRVEQLGNTRPTTSVAAEDLSLTQAFITVLHGTGHIETDYGDKARGIELHKRAVGLCEKLYRVNSDAPLPEPQLALSYHSIGHMYCTYAQHTGEPIATARTTGITYLRKALTMRRALFSSHDSALLLESATTLIQQDIPVLERLEIVKDFRQMLLRMRSRLQPGQFASMVAAFAFALERHRDYWTAEIELDAPRWINELYEAGRVAERLAHTEKQRLRGILGVSESANAAYTVAEYARLETASDDDDVDEWADVRGFRHVTSKKVDPDADVDTQVAAGGGAVRARPARQPVESSDGHVDVDGSPVWINLADVTTQGKGTCSYSSNESSVYYSGVSVDSRRMR